MSHENIGIYLGKKLLGEEGWWDTALGYGKEAASRSAAAIGSALSGRELTDPALIKDNLLSSMNDLNKLKAATSGIETSAGLQPIPQGGIQALGVAPASTGFAPSVSTAGVMGGAGGAAAGYGVANMLGANDIKFKIAQLEAEKTKCTDVTCFNKLQDEIKALRMQHRTMVAAGTGIGAIGGALLGSKFGAPAQ